MLALFSVALATEGSPAAEARGGAFGRFSVSLGGSNEAEVWHRDMYPLLGLSIRGGLQAFAPWEFGGVIEDGAVVLGHENSFVGLFAGAVSSGARRYHVSAEAGGHRMDPPQFCIFGCSDLPPRWVPFAGVNAGAEKHIGDEDGAALLGIHIGVRSDLQEARWRRYAAHAGGWRWFLEFSVGLETQQTHQ
jgi:hypothetical protein